MLKNFKDIFNCMVLKLNCICTLKYVDIPVLFYGRLSCFSLKEKKKKRLLLLK